MDVSCLLLGELHEPDEPQTRSSKGLGYVEEARQLTQQRQFSFARRLERNNSPRLLDCLWF